MTEGAPLAGKPEVKLEGDDRVAEEIRRRVPAGEGLSGPSAGLVDQVERARTRNRARK
ncbi:MAG: hypothetical protein R3F62_24100 [Planctomycetota bacterium]